MPLYHQNSSQYAVLVRTSVRVSIWNIWTLKSLRNLTKLIYNGGGVGLVVLWAKIAHNVQTSNKMQCRYVRLSVRHFIYSCIISLYCGNSVHRLVVISTYASIVQWTHVGIMKRTKIQSKKFKTLKCWNSYVITLLHVDRLNEQCFVYLTYFKCLQFRCFCVYHDFNWILGMQLNAATWCLFVPLVTKWIFKTVTYVAHVEHGSEAVWLPLIECVLDWVRTPSRSSLFH